MFGVGVHPLHHRCFLQLSLEACKGTAYSVKSLQWLADNAGVLVKHILIKLRQWYVPK